MKKYTELAKKLRKIGCEMINREKIKVWQTREIYLKGDFSFVSPHIYHIIKLIFCASKITVSKLVKYFGQIKE